MSIVAFGCLATTALQQVPLATLDNAPLLNGPANE
jgi:hypothetical protein